MRLSAVTLFGETLHMLFNLRQKILSDYLQEAFKYFVAEILFSEICRTVKKEKTNEI